MVNAKMVNRGSRIAEWAEICKKISILGRFLARKNAVNYVSKFIFAKYWVPVLA
jgi:hypothetical protein